MNLIFSSHFSALLIVYCAYCRAAKWLVHWHLSRSLDFFFVIIASLYLSISSGVCVSSTMKVDLFFFFALY
jgi:hypothetical protein